MLEQETRHSEHGHDGHHHDHCERTVAVHVNNEPVYVHIGDLPVETLKRLAKVPLADDLDQLIGGKLVPLRDDGKVHLMGCEVFLSHPKDGGSS